MPEGTTQGQQYMSCIYDTNGICIYHANGCNAKATWYPLAVRCGAGCGCRLCERCSCRAMPYSSSISPPPPTCFCAHNPAVMCIQFHCRPPSGAVQDWHCRPISDTVGIPLPPPFALSAPPPPRLHATCCPPPPPLRLQVLDEIGIADLTSMKAAPRAARAGKQAAAEEPEEQMDDELLSRLANLKAQ